MTEDDNIVILDVMTRLDIPAERVLKSALEHGLKNVSIVGYDENEEIYFASSLANASEILWALEKFKKRLMEME